MPSKCAVQGCIRVQFVHKWEDDTKTMPLSFFKFPSKNEETIMKWLQACGRTELTLENCKACKICSMHFQPSDILGNRQIMARLKIGAIPCRHLPDSSQTTIPCKKRKIFAACSIPDDSMAQTSPVLCTVHPVNINCVLPTWHYQQTDGVTWYFQVCTSGNVTPTVHKSVKVPQNGSVVQFYIGTEAVPQHICATLLENQSIHIKEEFIVVCKRFNDLCIKYEPWKFVICQLQSALNDDVPANDNKVKKRKTKPCSQL